MREGVLGAHLPRYLPTRRSWGRRGSGTPSSCSGLAQPPKPPPRPAVVLHCFAAAVGVAGLATGIGGP